MAISHAGRSSRAGAPAMGAKALCIPFKQLEELFSDAGCVGRG